VFKSDSHELKLRTVADGSRYRDSEHVHGTCAVLSNRREGTFDVRVPVPADSSDADRSPWEGMAGAAVLSGGRIIGVVAKHHQADGLGRLATYGCLDTKGSHERASPRKVLGVAACRGRRSLHRMTAVAQGGGVEGNRQATDLLGEARGEVASKSTCSSGPS
jgi:hypothetical protein